MLRKIRLNRLIMIVISIVMVSGMKYHYSYGNSEALKWILAPTSYLVEMTGNMNFIHVENTGYVDVRNMITIAPSCSGVNFMIIVFLLSIYTGLKRFDRPMALFMWLIFSMAASFTYTLIINTLRINLSVYSFKTGFLASWFSIENVHLTEGVIVYFLFLLIYYSILDRNLNSSLPGKKEGHIRQVRTDLLVMAVYFTVTLFIPFLNQGGFLPEREFIDYAGIILVTCPVVLLMFFMFRISCHYLAVKLKY